MQLVNKFDKIGKVPYLISGGAGTNTHVIDLIKSSNCSGVVIGSALHYKKITIKELKKDLFKNNIQSRR